MNTYLKAIGELLENRKNYLKSLKNPTQIQINKLDFINKLMIFIDNRILNVEIYKILNGSSTFADDFNQYILYLLMQKIVNIFPENERDLLILNAIQFFSTKNIIPNSSRIKYSNMGFMYMIKIMSLMTDKENFYAEVNERIFKPLKIEEKFIPVHILTKENLKNKFPNQNYYSKFRDVNIRVNIYDINYNEMDSLNGGLISDLDSTIKATCEISKMYLGLKNLLTNIPETSSKLFFKYKSIYGNKENELYSLGTYFIMFDDKINIEMTGNAFNKSIEIYFSIHKINRHPNINSRNYIYNLNDYNKAIDLKVKLGFTNHFLYSVFFQDFEFSSKYSKNILSKSIYDTYNNKKNIDLDNIEWYIEYKPNKLINILKYNIEKNISELKISNLEKEKLRSEFSIYIIKKLNKNLLN